METIKIDKQEYVIPQGWNELTLQQYIDLMSIPSGFTPSNKLIKIFEYVCGIPVEMSKKLDFNQLKAINNLLDWMNKPYTPAPVEEFEFEGIVYKAEPVGDSVFGAYIDYETFLDRHGAIAGLPYLIAVMARKDGESYDQYDTYKRAEQFKKLPLTVALDLSAFFLTNIEITKIHTQTILNLKHQVQNQRNSTLNSLNNSDGNQSFLRRWQNKILLRLMKYLDKKLPSSSII